MFYIAITITIAGKIMAYSLPNSFGYREACHDHVEAMLEQWGRKLRNAVIEFECRKHELYSL